ncbi:uncharacterized protein LOC118465630 [Anopheles albimanus]|uniref:Spaetzle domain-containing protein n=1 Tax=Anopheles albimanus TaxID=7167 RepID=A0A1Y9G8D7_ANOAL|nr:uncharacterized protein LOC118465630 [Anopheles albimanus]
MRLARVSVKVQGAGVCVLLACLLHSAVVHSSENAPPTLQEELSGVLEQGDPLVEPEPLETEGLGLEARMALPDAKEIVDENKMIGAVINKEGGLDPVYPANRSVLTRNKRYALRVLQLKEVETKVVFGEGSHPAHYPMERILRALAKPGTGYEHVFAKELVVQNLTERISSPSDGYMCASKISQEYPTYDPVTKTYIVNVEGFYQGISFDECSEVGALCSDTCQSQPSQFVCHQSYGTMEVVVARETRKDGEIELALERIHYPSSCKCQRLPGAI